MVWVCFILGDPGADSRDDTIGSSSNYDEDHDEDFKKTIGLMNKTTVLHVHHAF